MPNFDDSSTLLETYSSVDSQGNMPYTDSYEDVQDETLDRANNFEFTPNMANGISQAELNDPNKIRVTIADESAPLVILFGPPSCGKTMTLVRLTRYLSAMGYTISPIRTFRPSYDTHYAELCDNFDAMVGSYNAATATNKISFMLVEVIKNGNRVCQILEAPGEYYFNPDRPSEPFPAYVNTIIHSRNRKVWCSFVEPDWMDCGERGNYAKRIAYLKSSMNTADKTIFVFNKIDKTNFVVSPGVVRMKQAQKEVNNLYPGIFQPFKNENPITSLFTKWRCKFVPFQTGSFTKAADGTLTFQQGSDKYPKLLWNNILSYVRG